MFDREIAQINALMTIAEFAIRRIYSLRKQLQEDPNCGLQGKLEAYESDLKKIQIRMHTIYQHITVKQGIMTALATPQA